MVLAMGAGLKACSGDENKKQKLCYENCRSFNKNIISKKLRITIQKTKPP